MCEQLAWGVALFSVGILTVCVLVCVCVCVCVCVLTLAAAGQRAYRLQKQGPVVHVSVSGFLSLFVSVVSVFFWCFLSLFWKLQSFLSFTLINLLSCQETASVSTQTKLSNKVGSYWETEWGMNQKQLDDNWIVNEWPLNNCDSRTMEQMLISCWRTYWEILYSYCELIIG